MDTRELEAFVAIAEQGSFSAAASGLHLTQSAVSRRIAGLEDRLAARLFDRIGRRTTLTEAGRALLPRARKVLLDLEDTSRVIRNLTGAVGGALTLATSHHIGLHRLPPVLRAFTRAHPQVNLDLRFLDSEAAHELLLQGHLELAVVTLAPAGSPPLEVERVWRDPLAFVAAPDHPLARRRELDLAELADTPAILPGPGTYTGRIVAELFDAHGLDLASTMSTNYLETIHMMVRIGLGWSVLPASMVDGDLRELPIRPRVRLERQLGWVRHPERTPSNAALAFVEVLREAADAGD